MNDDARAARLEQRCKDLEKQVELLWSVLKELPRLDGIHDTIYLESSRLDTKPRLPESER